MMGWFLKSWRPAHNAKKMLCWHISFVCMTFLYGKVPRKFKCTWLSESKTAFLSCRRKYRSISPLIISWNCSRLNSPCSPRSRPLSGTQIFALKFNRSVKITSFKIKNKRNEKERSHYIGTWDDVEVIVRQVNTLLLLVKDMRLREVNKQSPARKDISQSLVNNVVDRKRHQPQSDLRICVKLEVLQSSTKLLEGQTWIQSRKDFRTSRREQQRMRKRVREGEEKEVWDSIDSCS